MVESQDRIITIVIPMGKWNIFITRSNDVNFTSFVFRYSFSGESSVFGESRIAILFLCYPGHVWRPLDGVLVYMKGYEEDGKEGEEKRNSGCFIFFS